MAGLREAISWAGGGEEAPITKAISGLYMVTARRSEETDDRIGLIETTSRMLARLPCDLVLKAIDDYRGVFFPKLDEIRLPIERSREYRQRLGIVRAFREAVDRLQGPPRAARRMVTAEDRAIVSAGYRRLRSELA